MIGNKIIGTLCTAVCMVFAGAAAASDGAPKQTVEGAQAFLSQVLPGQDYMPGSFIEIFEQVKRAQNHPNMGMDGRARIVEVSPVAKCVSTLRYDLTPIDLVYGRERANFVRNFAPDLALRGDAKGFSWGTVFEVKQYGTSVSIMFKENKVSSTIYLNAESLAKRVAFAIEFLRLHCDETAKTGF